MELTLDSNVQYIPRVGPAMAARLLKLGIRTVGDLLYHTPFRYNDFSNVLPIKQARVGQTITVTGVIDSHKTFITKTGKRVQKASVSDQSGKIDVIWFNQMYLPSVLTPGLTVNLAGTVSWFGNSVALIAPDYEIVDAGSDEPSLHTGRMVPVYPETEGVSSKWMRGRIAYLLERGLHKTEDFIPESILKEHALISLSEALSHIHFPSTGADIKQAKRRLAFGELFLFKLRALMERYVWETTQKSIVIYKDQSLETFIKSLPFELTDDQQRVIGEILNDMQKPFPMNRLLEGDVGSGKTVVSAVAMYASYVKGYSSIIMAPTQILAEQHAKTLQTVFSAFDIPVTLILGGNTNKQTQISPDKPGIIVGTHALLSEQKQFQNVALIVIDEQQRFGVEQRMLLREKTRTGDKTPHVLTMTATPIPRTIALALYGNLDLSVISHLPVGRKRVRTWIVPNEKRDSAYQWINKELKTNGTQAFIVCPIIEESETLATVKSVKSEFLHLTKQVFPNLKLGLLHGRMKPKEKSQVLEKMKHHELDILVATPVVEVGIDIPNASIMVIEAGERYGLSQLHQLRGRVGRSDKQAYGLIFTEATDELALKRLKALETVHSGPELAEIDLSIRGPGELFGTRQHGMPNLRFGSLFDTQLLEMADHSAQQIIALDPTISGFPLLRQALENGTIETSSIE